MGSCCTAASPAGCRRRGGLPSPPRAPTSPCECEVSVARGRTVRWCKEDAEANYLVYASLYSSLPWSRNYQKMEGLTINIRTPRNQHSQTDPYESLTIEIKGLHCEI